MSSQPGILQIMLRLSQEEMCLERVGADWTESISWVKLLDDAGITFSQTLHILSKFWTC